MPLTISNYTGDGATAPKLDTYIQLPDSGTTVLVGGSVTAVNLPLATITGSPLTMPVAPGSGSIFWNIQVDQISGAATVQQSTTADPAPVNGNTLVIFRQTLVPGSIDPATTLSSTPDTW